jgi:hypothetical protein
MKQGSGVKTLSKAAIYGVQRTIPKNYRDNNHFPLGRIHLTVTNASWNTGSSAFQY